MTKRDQLIGADGEVDALEDISFAKAKRGRPAMLPSEKKVRMNLMIDARLVERLKDIGNKSAFVNEAIRKAFER